MQRQPTLVVEVDADEKYLEPQALRGSVPATVTNQAVTNQPFGGSIPEQSPSHAAFIGKKMHKDAMNDLFELKSSPGEVSNFFVTDAAFHPRLRRTSSALRAAGQAVAPLSPPSSRLRPATFAPAHPRRSSLS